MSYKILSCTYLCWFLFVPAFPIKKERPIEFNDQLVSPKIRKRFKTVCVCLSLATKTSRSTKISLVRANRLLYRANRLLVRVNRLLVLAKQLRAFGLSGETTTILYMLFM